MKCCERDMLKVILYGLPMFFCEECSILSGVCANVMRVLPFNGAMFHYQGSYIKGLIDWFRYREVNL